MCSLYLASSHALELCLCQYGEAAQILWFIAALMAPYCWTRGLFQSFSITVSEQITSFLTFHENILVGWSPRSWVKGLEAYISSFQAKISNSRAGRRVKQATQPMPWTRASLCNETVQKSRVLRKLGVIFSLLWHPSTWSFLEIVDFYWLYPCNSWEEKWLLWLRKITNSVFSKMRFSFISF